ncbi:MAG: FAD-dependent oxidoreductase, partial [Halieaceae bacterium]
MQVAAIQQQDLVMVGGGHAHALALRMLAMRPVAGLRITLISPNSHTPYSGMLPGLIAGHYTFKETHIDLARLCQWAGVRFIECAVTALNPEEKRLSLAGRPPLAYDLLSLDIGSQPELDSVPGAREHALPIKPVAELWQTWQRWTAQLSGQEGQVAVVGGG